MARNRVLTPENIGPYVDHQLKLIRPDRYDVGDDSWRHQLYAEIERYIPAQEARQVAAKMFVDQREGASTRRANQLLRRIGIDKAWPTEYDPTEDGRMPLAIGDQRVCVAACTADDLIEWEIVERRRASQDFASRIWACDGALWIHEQLKANREWPTFGQAVVANLRSNAA